MSSVEEPINFEDSSGLQCFWEWKCNVDPWNTAQISEWQRYPDDISMIIEAARRCGSSFIDIDQTYRIDFKHYLQRRIDDPEKQRPVRRIKYYSLGSSMDTMAEVEEYPVNKRLFSRVDMVSCSIVRTGSKCRSSSFVCDWFALFTKDNRKVKFDNIFPILHEGLCKEGVNEQSSIMNTIMNALDVVKNETMGKKNKQRMKELRICCAILYTMDCYIHSKTNDALSKNDHTKLNTLGPFCYLLFNYIGQKYKESPITDRILQAVRSNTSAPPAQKNNDDISDQLKCKNQQSTHSDKPELITVYRGSSISNELKNEYYQAINDNSKCFQSLRFLSTSLDRAKAEEFKENVLYVIKLDPRTTKDQFSYLSKISDFPEEKEILLLPGARFRVQSIKYDESTYSYEVHVEILPSFMFTIR